MWISTTYRRGVGLVPAWAVHDRWTDVSGAVRQAADPREVLAMSRAFVKENADRFSEEAMEIFQAQIDAAAPAVAADGAAADRLFEL